MGSVPERETVVADEAVQSQKGKAVVDVKRLSCPEVGEHVTAYLDDELADDARRALEEHTRGCADCTRHIAQFRATIAAMRDLPATSLSPVTRDRLLSAFRAARRR
ncbi:anti-sigma factor [Spongiactinospora gelatinilytica]|uniref:Anti-sigma factor n=1 Tax=Spongiactinospora gelatinilytica TaxID=2666298 RepID=A0A2W2FQD5_9ACTN|nr:anti-sigma factor [Spongiactinospora gelatinilytica]